MTKILVIEDDADIRSNVVEILEAAGFDPLEAATGEQGVELALCEHPQVVLCDIMLPGIDGYTVLERVRQDPVMSGSAFVFLTARAGKNEMREGMNLGADDYLTKPFSRAELLGAIETRLRRLDALARQALDAASPPPSERLEGSAQHEPLVVAPEMRAVYDQARRFARSTLNVLILGETGTGKDVLAEAIHAASPRADKPFLPLNCTAIQETLIESELFGHEKGAYTGATGKKGLFEAADGGTVFLDEIGDLPASIQSKLLRVLQDRRVRRVGGLTDKEVDVRFICATNRDLDAAIAAGTFRSDLFFRIQDATLALPPLRARKDEIEPLARAFLERASADLGQTKAPALSPEALRLLEAHDWPGNVRELRSVMNRAVALCAGSVILPEHLPREITAARDSRPPPSHDPPPSALPASTPYDQLKQEARVREKERIIQALEECGGNQTKAAELLGISRRTLVTRIKELGIPRPRGD